MKNKFIATFKGYMKEFFNFILSDKPHKAEPYKSKQHVRIATAPHQFEEHDKGEDSDETLCSDKEDGTR